uniref:SPG11 vesicle trafficking associated, spatacsin n=1 Tax=Oreochromis niloticus TaxID=8128 RepID=A0A669F7L2_ORENI
MLEVDQRLQAGSTEVAVIPENQHCGDVADIRKAELAPGGSLLGCLGVRGQLVVWDPADREASPAAVEGSYRDFSWEEVSVHSRGVGGFRLLAVGSQGDLKLLEVRAERSAFISVLCVCECPADRLLQTVRDQDPGVSELQVVQVLSFVTGRCCVLLNSDWLLQLQWQQEEEEPQTLSCCRVQLADGDSCSAVHHCVSMETLFALSSTGLISVCSVSDGTLLAKDELTSFPFSSSPSFCLLQVSADLSTAVAVTQSHAAVAVDLNHYFRMFPDHLLCAAPRPRPPLQPQHPRDQDSLSSSGFSISALGATFSADRSWEARLTFLYSRAQQATAPSSSSSSSSRPPRTSSWFSSLPHLDSHLAPSSAHSRVPPGGLTVAFAVPESSASSQLTVSEFSALLTFVRPGNQQTTVALWDIREYGNVSYHQAAGEAAPVQRCGERQHRLLLKKAGVFQVLFSVSQQDLLSRLMLFGSAATVDAVCHLNSWGRCSIPIHALQTGLKNRQLDTVDFYLKSKENVLNPPAAAFSSADHPAASTLRVQELCPALDLLCSAVRDSNSEAQSRQFSEQLLNITLSFVNTQIRSVLSNTHHEDSAMQSCINVLDRYVAELRSYMKRFPWAAGPDVSATRAAAPAKEEAQRDEWEQLSAEEMIHQSILTNQIPRAQAVLRSQNRPERRLSALRREGLRQVFSCLQRRDLETTNTLLANMGFSVKQQLHLICLHTDDEELRELMVSLACHVNTNSLFLTLRIQKLPGTVRMARKEGGGEEVLKELEVQRRPREEEEEEERGGLWRKLRLDWVKNWDQSCRTAVLLSRLQACDAAVLWRYLTVLHDQRRVVDWIQNTETSGAPRWPDLTPELVNDSTACSSYMRENILDLLARYKHRGLCTGVLVRHSSTPPSFLSPVVVELLIVAHDCFSVTCNMEGIVRVLQAARHLSHTYLAPGGHYSLLVRLLTGISRYNEMTYVFDLLHQNHCFEMLLRKKSSSLKSALLDYIKRCLPADSEKYNMVALCFTMRREIGENHEIAARTQLKMIESQAWVITPELKSSLVKVLGLLKDAAESFSKDSCVRQATRCVRTAKLVALQLHFLNQGSDLRIINLRPAELLSAAMALPRCYQVFVVSEAYGYSPDWAEILYQKVVLNGDFGYLEELKRHRPLTSTLFEDIFKKLEGAPGSVTSNVKRLLTYCDDVYSRYRLAYQQNLHDVTKMLLQDAKTSSYLSDRLGS